MSKIISLALSVAAAFVLAAAPIPVMADGPSARERPKTLQSGEPTTRHPPIFRNSPTDEYVPPRTSRADTRLSTMFTAPSRAAPSLLAPGSGPPARVPMTGSRQYYTYQPGALGYDRAPCPTRSRDSLGELFSCTLR